MALFSKDPAPSARTDVRVGNVVPAGGTFVGPNITVEGTITGSEPISIEGTIRGSIDL